MLATLQNTPFWVYVVFLAVVYIGLKALKPIHENRTSLLVTPPLLLVCSLFPLNLTVDPGLTLGVWFIALLVGAVSAWMIFPRNGVALDDQETGLIVAGSWKGLVILLLFFAANYYAGFQDDVHPERSAQTDMQLFKAGVWGFFYSLLGTRSMKYYWLLRTLQTQRPPLGAR